MVVQQVELAVLDEQEPPFEAALCEVRQRVFMSPGFRRFDVAQGAERSWTYLVRIEWASLDELTEHAASGRFDRCWAPVQPFLAGAMRVDHFVERPALGLQGPGVITDLAWLSE